MPEDGSVLDVSALIRCNVFQNSLDNHSLRLSTRKYANFYCIAC